MPKRPLVVVALGGNAISQPNEEGNVAQQFANSRNTARQLADLYEQGHRLVITHGNGPQIGNFLLRNDAAADTIYPLSMEVAVAHVQGGMGFMLAQTLTNELVRRGHDLMVTAVVTTVLVDAADPAFRNPTKPVGRTMSHDETRAPGHEAWTFREVAPGRYTRLIASPRPLKILEIEHIRRSVQAGELLVACGGGGVPVVRDPGGDLCGTHAVIDKDLASALLAAELGADAMVILTPVERVCLHYGTPQERTLERVTVAQAKRWLEEGQFPAGSMGPKIEAAIEFLEHSKARSARVLITSCERAADALAGKTGTWIERG
jgi:carbamate kinase